MEKRHRDLINVNINKLSDHTNFTVLVGYLERLGVFTKSQLQKYESTDFGKNSEVTKCRIMYEDLQTRGPEAFNKLLHALKITGHAEMLEILNSTKSDHVQRQIVKLASSLPSCDFPVYQMTSKPRGLYLIINNIDFKFLDSRAGAKHDEDLKDVLDGMGFLGYNGGYIENLTAEEMEKILRDLSHCHELKTVDSLIVVIMSHGGVNNEKKIAIKGINCSEALEDVIEQKTILEIFSNEQCTLKQGQPRIFVFQACRGKGSIKRDYSIEGRTSVQDERTNCADTFVIAPTVEGFLSMRDPARGTWLITCLIEVLVNYSCDTSLVDMIIKLNARLEDQYSHYTAANHIPETRQLAVLNKYGVTKELYFNPGLC